MSSDCILEADHPPVYLEQGNLTQSGRVAPIQQIECAVPVSARCEIQNRRWVCVFNDTSIRMKRIQCEGCAYPRDPLILRDSCGIQCYIPKSTYKHVPNTPLEIITHVILLCIITYVISKLGSTRPPSEAYDYSTEYDYSHEEYTSSSYESSSSTHGSSCCLSDRR